MPTLWQHDKVINMFQPDAPVQQPTEQPAEMSITGTGDPVDAPIEDESKIIAQNLEKHLDTLPENDKMFLAEHLTPEFVRAIGLINGPEVAQYLAQFADPDKVLVPVPRAVAEEHLQQQKASQGAAQSQPQGGSIPTQQAPTEPMGGGFVPPSNPQRLPS